MGSCVVSAWYLSFLAFGDPTDKGDGSDELALAFLVFTKIGFVANLVGELLGTDHLGATTTSRTKRVIGAKPPPYWEFSDAPSAHWDMPFALLSQF